MDDSKSLVMAQQMYTSQLLHILTPYLMQGILSIFDDVLAVDKRNVLRRFQSELGNIPKWNQHIIDDEVRRIVRHADAKSNVKLDDLVTSIFVCNARILSSVSTSVREGRINLKIPKIGVFIHHVYIEVARKMYKNVYLFDISKSIINKQKNMHEVELLVQASIINTLQNLLPMQDIIHNYVTSPDTPQTQNDVSLTPLAIAAPPESSIDLSESRQLLEDIKADDDTMQIADESRLDNLDEDHNDNDLSSTDRQHQSEDHNDLNGQQTSDDAQDSLQDDEEETHPSYQSQEETNSKDLISKRPFELVVDDVSDNDVDDHIEHYNKHGPQLHLDVVASDVDDYDPDADTSVKIDYGSDSSRTRNESKADSSKAHGSNIDIYMDMSDEEPVNRAPDDQEYAYTDDELMSDKEDDISDFIKKLRDSQQDEKDVTKSSTTGKNNKMNVFIGDLGSRKITADTQDNDETQVHIYKKNSPKNSAQISQKDKRTIRIFDDSSDDDTEHAVKAKKSRKKPARERKQLAETVDLTKDSSTTKPRKKVQLFPDAISEDELD